MTSQEVLDRVVEYWDYESSWLDDYSNEQSEYGDNGDDSVYLHDDGEVY